MRSIDSLLIKDKVVAELRKAILLGNFKVGEMLYQDKIAEQLGVSRLPVREALQVLHNEGLITVKPNKVAYVNEVSTKFLHDHFYIRTLLEREAVRLACENHIDCAPIRKLVLKAEEAIVRGDFRTFDDCNQSFHDYLWKASNNVVLERQLARLWNAVISDEANVFENVFDSNADHLKIIEAMEAGDVETAMDLIAVHVNRSYQRVLEQMAEQSGQSPE